MRKTAKEVVDKMIRRAGEAVQDYQDGVQKTDKSPMQEAKKKKAKMRANFIAALDNGDWERGLDSVSDEEWKRRTVKMGGERYASGLEDSRQKSEAIMEDTLTTTYNVADEVNKLPDTTPQDRINKMVEYAKRRGAAKKVRRRR